MGAAGSRNGEAEISRKLIIYEAEKGQTILHEQACIMAPSEPTSSSGAGTNGRTLFKGRLKPPPRRNPYSEVTVQTVLPQSKITAESLRKPRRESSWCNTPHNISNLILKCVQPRWSLLTRQKYACHSWSRMHRVANKIGVVAPLEGYLRIKEPDPLYRYARDITFCDECWPLFPLHCVWSIQCNARRICGIL